MKKESDIHVAQQVPRRVHKQGQETFVFNLYTSLCVDMDIGMCVGMCHHIHMRVYGVT